MYEIGTKASLLTTLAPFPILMSVGSTKFPGLSNTFPPTNTSPPSCFAFSIVFLYNSTAALLWSGPTKTPSSKGSPILIYVECYYYYFRF